MTAITTLTENPSLLNVLNKFRKADITVDDLGEGSYDMLLSRGVVVSHLPKIEVIDWLKSASRLTKPGGYFVFDFILEGCHPAHKLLKI